MERYFQAYREPLEVVTLFKYMVRVLTAGDNDWLEMAGNLRKAKNTLMCMKRILIHEG